MYLLNICIGTNDLNQRLKIANFQILKRMQVYRYVAYA